MAAVQLSDVVIPEVYLDYTTVNTPEKTDFWRSGIVTRTPMFDEKANGGGNIGTLPFWRDLDPTSEPNVSNDDPGDHAVPEKINTGVMTFRNAYLNKGYSATDLAGELAGSDPMRRIRDRFGVWWQRQWQRRLIASAQGVLADNIANDAGDMVIQSGATFNRNSFTAAIFTLGDMATEITAVAVHSSVMKQIVDNEDVEYVKIPSEGEIPVPFFMGKRLIMDDSLPRVATTAPLGTAIFTSILFGQACFGYGVGSPKVPVEVERDASAGNGGGVETIWERVTWLLHPFGFSFTSASVAELSATNAELRLAANWDRVVPRKNIPMAFLTSTLTTPTP